MIIETSIGPANVLHRLALAVYTIDALTGRPGLPGVRVGREVDLRRLPRSIDHSWPAVDLPVTGIGRCTLLQNPRLPDALTIRIVDPSRRVAPRRLRVPLRRAAERAAADPPPARSRLLQPWLLPGSATSLSRAATAIRGRIERDGVAVRWPRITASGPGDALVGWAHGDERGEFLLVLGDTGTLPPPAPSTLDVTLTVSAPRRPVPRGESADCYGDLVIEDVPRSAMSVTPPDLDIRLLRGQLLPPGYVVNATGSTQPIAVTVGELLTLPAPIAFAA